MTVARGMGGEGSAVCRLCTVANDHMTVGRWGKGGRGSGGGGGGGGEGERGGKGGGWDRQGGRGGGEGGERAWRGPGGGPTGGQSSPPSIKPVGWPRALKKIEIRPGPAR